MTNRIRVTPTEGARVRYPIPNTHKVLPAEGADVADEIFWRRREAAGEVTISPPTDDDPPAPADDIETGFGRRRK